ncbi:hypothetical protein DASC09_063770 [Saccharomycopsis crataegensis]|uniref:Uncharacterized protein n=1 Tax=Saccharomycopsis crataegensis TaxID=43959 RepID=A0AAV5QVZ9_9ASCO|nr:hypothetical protein DASC09_063770 [Saccharomycopsis crataegensis]
MSSDNPNAFRSARGGRSIRGPRGRGRPRPVRFQTSLNTEPLSNDDQEKLKQRALRFSTNNKDQGKNYGLVSRGEDNTLQLNRNNEREKFFADIKKQFILHCSSYDSVEGLREDLTNIKDHNKSQKTKVEEILMNLRKLREALLNAKPTEFTAKVFLYSIKVGSRSGHYQTYVPCISYLISNVIENKHADFKLQEYELDEIIGIYILHLAHFNLKTIDKGHIYSNYQDLSQCFQLFFKYIPHNYAIKKILKAVGSNDYVTWFNTYANELRSNLCYQMIINKLALNKIIQNLLLVLNSSYFMISVNYLEQDLLSGVVSYDYLKANFPQYCGHWKLNEGTIIIRERKRKPDRQ